MRFNNFHILVAAALMLLRAGATLAAEPPPSAVIPEPTAIAAAPDPATAAAAPAPTTSSGTAAAAAAAAPSAPPQQCCCPEELDPLREFALRVGAWGTSPTGSRAKVGEYQDLKSSPFWDVDGLMSDGCRTLDYSATGTDDQDTQANLHYYGGPGLSADIDYQRFPHQLETTKYYPGFGVVAPGGNPPGKGSITPTPSTNPSNTNLYTYTNLSPGTDYAISVQEFKADFKGDLDQQGVFRWRVNVFGMDKQGDRQENALTHCFQNAYYPTTPLHDNCHANSVSQYIDWQTTEVEPMLEARLSRGLTVQYSHVMRSFRQDDEMVTSDWNAPSSSFGNPGFVGPGNPNGNAGFGIVPDSTTSIDRLKVRAELNEDTDAYVTAMAGDTKDDLNLMNRHYGSVDARITNNSIDGLTLTGRAKEYTENTEAQATTLNNLYPSEALLYQQAGLPTAVPINRDTTTAGVDARWRPFYGDYNNLAFTAGYEYAQLRTNAAYTISTTPTSVFEQPDTNTNTFSVGVEEKWNLNLTSYVRYKYITTQYPLYGVTPNATTLDGALDTLLPTLENRVEIGSTWTVSDRLLVNGEFYIEQASNHGPYAYFDSTDFPFFISMMYTINDKWSLNGGYGNFNNNINQNITLGFSSSPGTTPYTAPWQYLSRSDVFNLGAVYAYSSRLKLSGSVEYVRGLNTITDVPTPSGATSFADIAGYSAVIANTYEVTAGIDYLWRPGLSTYFRYNFSDYGDEVTGLLSGKVHMFMGGMTALF